MKNGYIHHFGKTIGGIKHILLTPACNITNTVLDPNGSYKTIILQNPAKLAECSFAESAIHYREETNNSNGIPFVVHTLEFNTDKIDQESDRLIRILTETSCCGLAAVITTNNDTRLVVGYSQEHGSERPLRLEKIAADSGRISTDTGHEAIRLISRDAAKARILDGTIG